MKLHNKNLDIKNSLKHDLTDLILDTFDHCHSVITIKLSNDEFLNHTFNYVPSHERSYQIINYLYQSSYFNSKTVINF